MPFKVIQGHRFRNKSKAHMRHPCLDGVSLAQNFKQKGQEEFPTNYYSCRKTIWIIFS